jgi:hypothetical protein
MRKVPRKLLARDDRELLGPRLVPFLRAGCDLNRPAQNLPNEPSSRLALRATHSHKHRMNQERLASRDLRSARRSASAVSMATSWPSGSRGSPVSSSRWGKSLRHRIATSRSDHCRATSGRLRSTMCKWLLIMA